MDTKKLRQKILDLAIRGKLVPQDPNDEPASVLLEHIRAEKERLIKEGKIKRSKKVAADDEIEAPFEIPESWEWVRLDDICSIKGGKRIPRGKNFSKIPTKHVYLRVTNMKSHTIIENEIKYIDEEVFQTIKNYTINSNDLYLTIAGTIGDVGTIPPKFDDMNLTENAAKLTNIICSKSFLMYALLSDIAQEHFSSRFHQVAQPKLSIETASSTIIPLPPLAEQKRIANEVERWFTLIDELESNESDLLKAVDKAKSKILDLAIHGKLVPQDPNDEPASVLLERIRAEKERLINEGKIKRNKKLAAEATLKVPFELSKGWCWCALPDLCSIPITDGTHQTPTYSDKEHGIPFISSKDVTTQRINWENIKYITKDLHESLYKRIAPQRNDILLAKNGTTGVAAMVENDSVFDIYVTLAVIRPINELVLPTYLWRIINSDFCKKQFDNHLTGIGLPNLHLTDIKKTIIPLPPYQEQLRIVAKIEELFAVLDSIKESLE